MKKIGLTYFFKLLEIIMIYIYMQLSVTIDFFFNLF